MTPTPRPVTRHVADLGGLGLRPADVAAYARSPQASALDVSLDGYDGEESFIDMNVFDGDLDDLRALR